MAAYAQRDTKVIHSNDGKSEIWEHQANGKWKRIRKNGKPCVSIILDSMPTEISEQRSNIAS